MLLLLQTSVEIQLLTFCGGHLVNLLNINRHLIVLKFEHLNQIFLESFQVIIAQLTVSINRVVNTCMSAVQITFTVSVNLVKWSLTTVY